MMNVVNYFYEDIDFDLEKEEKYNNWIIQLFQRHSVKLEEVNYIFCSDSYILEVNKTYLDHDYYTDIISFPYSTAPDPIKGDVFISVDRVIENAQENNVSFANELLRVMAHGLLHFIGYNDKTEEDSIIMRTKEEEAIKLFEK